MGVLIKLVAVSIGTDIGSGLGVADSVELAKVASKADAGDVLNNADKRRRHVW